MEKLYGYVEGEMCEFGVVVIVFVVEEGVGVVEFMLGEMGVGGGECGVDFGVIFVGDVWVLVVLDYYEFVFEFGNVVE